MGADEPRAYVRLIDAARDDLEGLLRIDPQIVRLVLKKLLLLERDRNAGEPLLGPLIGWRKLTVGDRDWRVVWRVTSDDRRDTVIEIAEVWAAGARTDAEVYDEVRQRVVELGDSPLSTALSEVIDSLGRHAGGIHAAGEPVIESVPDWLAEQLVHTAGLDRDAVAQMSLRDAFEAWEAYITKPRP